MKGERFAFIKGTPKLLGSPYEFKRCGKLRLWKFPNCCRICRESPTSIAIVRPCTPTQFNHAPAQIFMNTGSRSSGRPSMGAWMTYGLGSECKDLPGFVVLISGENQPGRRQGLLGQRISAHRCIRAWSFVRRATRFCFSRTPKACRRNRGAHRSIVLQNLNEAHLAQIGDPEIATRIASYEMAYRMQSSVPELVDISEEPASIHEMYGTEPGKKSFANNCLLARRLVERGVRFVQLYHRGWDNHGTSSHDDIVNRLPSLCQETDQAAAALIKDLKQRGLLDSTLVVWGGEFGRTPMNEARDDSKFLGRDHHPRAFTMWMAGGGIKPGITVGKTDELGYNIVEDPVDVHDLHATILHQMGIDHTKLTYRFQGRDFRLTDVAGNVVKKLVA